MLVRPRTPLEKILGCLFDVSIYYKVISLDWLPRQRVECAIYLEVLQDRRSLVGETRTQNHRVVHQIISYSTQQKFRDDLITYIIARPAQKLLKFYKGWVTRIHFFVQLGQQGRLLVLFVHLLNSVPDFQCFKNLVLDFFDNLDCRLLLLTKRKRFVETIDSLLNFAQIAALKPKHYERLTVR